MDRIKTRQVIARLLGAGITVKLQDGKLKTLSAPGAFTPELIDLVKHNKAALVAYLAAQAQADVGAEQIQVRQGQVTLPLSYAQQRLWFIDRLEGETGQYNIPMAYRIEGPFDLAGAGTAFARIIERHEILRTVYRQPNQAPEQQVLPPPNFNITRHDLTALSGEQQAQQLSVLAKADSRRAFDLSQDLMLRAAWVQLSATAGVLLVNIHHIAADGWSMTVLMSEFLTEYRAVTEGLPSAVAPPAIQYGDYALWQQSPAQRQKLQQRLDYWQQQLSDVPVVHDLPLDKPRPARPSFVGATVRSSISAGEAATLAALCRDLAITPFMLVHGLLSLMLSRHANNRDIVIGAPVAGRSQQALTRLIGCFVNTLVLRLDCHAEQSLADYLANVKAVNLAAQSHQEVPFEQLVEYLQVPRTVRHAPLCQIMLTVDNADKVPENPPGIQISPYVNNSVSAKWDLALNVQVNSQGWQFNWVYDTALFEAGTIERFNRHLQRLLSQAATAINAPLTQLDMLSAPERERLLSQLNDTGRHYSPYVGIHQMVARQAALTPQASAVSDGARQLSYRELEYRANQLAHYLIARGIGAEDFVAVCMKRSVDLPVVLLAVLKAGGAYVPLDPDYPQARLDYMLEDTAAKWLITSESLHQRFTETHAELLSLEQIDPELDGLAVTEPPTAQSDEVAERLAYVIYTSGSTGKPKGVLIEHRNAAALLHWSLDAFSAAEMQGVLAATSVCFDLCIFELFAPLCRGGQVIVVENILALRQHQALPPVTLINTVPSALVTLLETQSLPPGLLTANSAGEPLSQETVDALYRQGVGRVNDLYGPSEDTTYSTWSTRQAGGYNTIGRPLPNTRAYVLDEYGQLAPEGAMGELYLAGHGVTRGYHRRAELTEERFIANPFSAEPGFERAYRTGDLVRWLDSGNLAYVGRADSQVKLRGFRIELGEIETRLAKLPGVADAAVLCKELPAQGPQLVAYVIPQSMPVDGAPKAAFIGNLQAGLGETLPEYMVPQYLVLLAAFKRSPNGKLDRKALPMPQMTTTSDYQPPQNAKQQALCEIYQGLLQREQVGIDDDFFRLGGHSLLATRLVARVEAELAIFVPLRVLFEHPTVRGFAAALDTLNNGETDPSLPAITAQPRDGDMPLSFAQRRLWFIEQYGSVAGQYNMPLALKIEGAIEPELIQAALQQIIERHEILRTSYHGEGEAAVQRVNPADGFSLNRVDLTVLDGAQQQVEVTRLAAEDAIKPFDLTSDLMLRASLLQLHGGDEPVAVLVLNMHHIASDGWSLGVLLKEFSAHYQALHQGQAAELAPLSIQYGDYALWQHRHLTEQVLQQQVDYWREQLAGVPEVHSLTTDHPRGERPLGQAGALEQKIDPETAEAMQALAQSSGVTLFMLMHTAFAWLLSRYGNHNDVVFGTPVAGRLAPALEPLIGCFVNTLVLRTRLDPELSVRQALESVKQLNLEAQANQALPFEQLVDSLGLSRKRQHAPLVQILLLMNNNDIGAPEMAACRITPWLQQSQSAKFELTLNVRSSKNGIVLSWLYDKALFKTDTIARLNRHMLRLLQAMVQTPEAALAQLPLLGDDEINQQLEQLSGNSSRLGRALDSTQSIVSLFKRQVEQTPQNTALVCGKEQLDYAGLDRASNRLAHYLVAQGVTQGEAVGIEAKRTISSVVALLAIVKAGGAYVPLDGNLPRQRIEHMVRDAAIKHILCFSQDTETFEVADACCHPLGLDVESLCEQHSDSTVDRQVTGQDRAYINYTSGSTGTPKGVVIAHRSVVRLVKDNGFCDVNPDQTWLFYSSMSFDASTLELWAPLCNGAKLVVAPQQQIVLDELAECIVAERVDSVWMTAALFHQMAQQYTACFANVKRLLAGGDVLNALWVRRVLNEHPQLCVINGYGPTENTTFTCCNLMRSAVEVPDNVPIGKPIAHTRVYILDDDGHLLVPGAVGELCTSGAGLALEYLNQPELTAQKFIDHPFRPGEKLYRTGDLARWLPGGHLAFVARKDHQLKLRGYRIEPGEIEAAIRQHPAVADAAVLCLESAGTENEGDKRLAAYVVPHQMPSEAQKQALGLALAAALKQTLPSYMVPEHWALLAAFERTANGKLDRSKLPDTTINTGQHDYVEPVNATQRQMCEIWQSLLQLERVGIADDFFALGGHSLLATSLVSRVRSEFNLDVPLRLLFEHPTVATFCQVLSACDSESTPSLTKVDRTQALSLSFAQQRLWFIEQLTPGAVQYNMPFALKFSGKVDVALIERVLQTIIARHEVLRTVIVQNGEQASQQIRPEVNFALGRQDLTALAEAEQQTALRQWLKLESAKPFDLQQDLMVRGNWLALTSGENSRGVLVLTFHHIAFDGWSMAVLLKEFGALYRAFAQGEDNPLTELAVQYADYAHWQRAYLQGARLEQQRRFWLEQLADAPMCHQLPLDKPRPATPRYRGQALSLTVPGPLAAQLQALALAQGVTPFILMHSVFALLLGRYGNTADVVIGTPVANRRHQAFEPLLGFFVNTLVLRTQCGVNLPFIDWLAQVKGVNLAAQSHQDIPFEQLVEQLQVPRNRSHSPLFQVMLAMNTNEPAALALPSCELSPVATEIEFAKFDLTLNARLGSDALHLHWVFDQDLFLAETIARMQHHLVALLQAVVATPKALLSELVMLDKAELAAIARWNDTQVSYPPACSLHGMFEQYAATHPEQIAVYCGQNTLTFGQLNQQANRLAHRILACGPVTNRPVALQLERSERMIVAILAVLKAGGGYLPLAVNQPQARLDYVLQDAAAKLLISDSGQCGQVPVGVERILLDDEPVGDWPVDNPSLAENPANLAYVLYTSGSTGNPKGIMVEHHSVINLAYAIAGLALAEPGTSWGWLAAYTFDSSVKGLSQLMLGRPLSVLTDDHKQQVDALHDAVAAHHIGVLDCTPGLAQLWFDCRGEALLPNLIIGGEAIEPALWQQLLDWQQQYQKLAFNVYGPTECTVNSCWTKVEGAQPHIGRPVPNTKGYVLDGHGQPVPQGCVGELYIGGAGLARDYLNRPQHSSEHFVASPFDKATGERLYRSGDWVYQLPDGNLAYVGRRDNQVKIRGYRIETAEVQAQLMNCQQVSAAVVQCREVAGLGVKLVAYVISDSDVAPDSLAAQLRERLALTLLDYQIPELFVKIEALPLTANGKIDYRALPEPDAKPSRYRPPGTEVERRLCQVWQELLKLERVGIEDNFFELGGHSLLATRLLSRIYDAFGVRLSLQTVFASATVASLAAELVKVTPQQQTQGPTVAAVREDFPLSYAQNRLWLIDQMGEGSRQYNMPAAFDIQGRFDGEMFASALAELVQRHEILRTVFVVKDGEPRQQVLQHYRSPLERVDLTAETQAQQQQRIGRLMSQHSRHQFDLAAELPLKVMLIKCAEERHQLLFNIHHIASDGWSMAILIAELDALYRAQHQGVGHTLAPLPLQYGDFALWQRSHQQAISLEQGLQYWRERLAGAPQVHRLPLDKPRPAEQSFNGLQQVCRLDRALTAQIQRHCRDANVTLFIYLQTAFALLLSRYSGERDIVIGSPCAGRDHSELEGLIGFFINTLVVRTEIVPEHSFSQLLAQQKRHILSDFEHQQVPFDLLVEALNPERSVAFSPLVQVMLSVQNTPTQAPAIAGVAITPLGGEHHSVMFDLELTVVESADELILTWGYNCDLFVARTIADMADNFSHLLQQVSGGGQQPVAQLEILVEAQKQRLLQSYNCVSEQRVGDLCIGDILQRSAEEFADKPALSFGDVSLSYAELNQQVNRLAHWLLAQDSTSDKGATAQVVAIQLPRSFDLIVAMLAVVKSGKAYLPLDVAMPPGRAVLLLDDAQVDVVLTWQSLAEAVADTKREVVCLDAPSMVQVLATQPLQPPQVSVAPDSLAYVMYTSGSTGKPKGVMVTHDNVLSYCQAANAHYAIGPDDVVMQFASPSFDIFVEELYSALLFGAQLYLRDEDLVASGETFWHFVQRNQITVCSVPTAFWHLLCGQLGSDSIAVASLRLMIVGGEAMSLPMLKRWRGVFAEQVTLLNTYGPTETTVVASIFDTAQMDANQHSVPIGRGIEHVRLYVLDELRQLCPPGAIGELYIGGRGVARGYWQATEQTEQRFVPDPFSPESGVMFKSGDRVRYNSDGQLLFVERDDHQVKVRGFRVELEEIENLLLQHSALAQAVVRPLSALTAAQQVSDEQGLAAFVVPVDGAVVQDEQARGELITSLQRLMLEHLPFYMLPGAIECLDALPHTVGGKVDVRALPYPDISERRIKGFVAAKTATEQHLAELWQQVLGLEQIGMDEQLFELGANSRILVQLQLAHRGAGIDIGLRDLMVHQSIGALAAWFDGQADTQKVASLGSAMVPLNAIEPSNEVIYLVHPYGGTVECYRELAARLSTYQVIGVVAPFVYGELPTWPNLDVLAGDYAAKIAADLAGRGRQRCVLGGFSYGGALAALLVDELSKLGVDVAGLLMFDAYHQVLQGSKAEDLSQPMAELTGFLQLEAVPQMALALWRTLDAPQQIERFIAWLSAQPGVSLPPSAIAGFVRFHLALEQLASERFSRELSGGQLATQVLFCYDSAHPQAKDNCQAWQRFLPGVMTELPLDFRHRAFLTEPSLNALEAPLQAFLTEVEQKYEQ